MDLIVQFRDGDLTRQTARFERAGARLHRLLPLIHGAAISIRRQDLKLVQASPEVLSFAEEGVVKRTMDDVRPAVGADAAYSYGWTGRGIGVAVIDSGVSVNSDLTTSTGASRLNIRRVSRRRR